MTDMAQADRTLRQNNWPFDRLAAIGRLELQNAELVHALRIAYLDIQSCRDHTIDMLERIEAAIEKTGEQR